MKQSDTFQKEPVIRPVTIQFSKRDKVKADLALSLMLSKVSHLGTNKVGHVTTSRLSKSPSRNKGQIGSVSRKLTKCDKVPTGHAKVAAQRKTTECDKVATGHAKASAPGKLTKFDKVPKKSTSNGRAKTAAPRKLLNGKKKEQPGEVSKRIGRVVPPSINTDFHHGNESSSVSSSSTNRQNIQARHALPTSRSIESTHLDRVQTGLLSATVRKSPSVRSCDKNVQIGLVSPLIKNKNLHCEEVNVGHNISLSSLTKSTHNDKVHVLSSQVEGEQREHVAALVTTKSATCDKVQTARVSPSIRGKSKHCDKKVQDGSPSRESKSLYCAKVQPKHVTFYEDLWGDKLPTSIVTEASKKKATNSNKTIQVAHVSPSLKSMALSCEKVQVSHVSSPVSNHSTHRKKVESGHVSSSLQNKATNRDDGLQKGCVPRSVTNKPANKSSDCDKFQVGQTVTRKLKTAHGIKAAVSRMVTSSDKKARN
ncbi:uncharacterized protein [Amphiura filiformis]|uniref:uncharacterized protein n=1 Tax=Amphiura filiformis TaxID=82378 RepID=UPI003B215695